VMSFAVAQRTHEIGLRMALGASPRQVLRLVLEEGMLLALIGLGVGLAGTYFVGRLMETILYRVSALDPAATRMLHPRAPRDPSGSHGGFARRMSFV